MLHSFAHATAIRPLELDDFSGNARLITFDSLDGFPTHQFKDGDLTGTWTAEKGHLRLGEFDRHFENVPTASSGHAIASTGAATVPGQMQFEMDTPVRRFGMLISGFRSGYRLTAFDESEQLIGSVEQTMRGSRLAMFLGAEFPVPAKRIEIFEHVRNGGNEIYDDIRFETVPEPSASSALTFGAVAVWCRFRRGRRSA